MNNRSVTSSRTFEPTTKNRFIVYTHDQHNNEILPSYVIKKVERPSFVVTPSGKKTYSTLTLICYEPIHPNISDIIYNKTDVLLNCTSTINTIDPVGQIIESYKIPNAQLVNVTPDCLNWSYSDVLLTQLTFTIDTIEYTSYIQNATEKNGDAVPRVY